MADTIPDFDKLWDYNNPAETEKKFREVEDEIKASGDTAYYAELLTQIARTQGLQMKFDEAHRILDDAEKLLKDNQHRAQIRYLLERGRTYNSSKVYDKARELFIKAYELGLKTGEDNLTVDAAHMMGIVEKAEESLKWNEIAMKHAEQSKDEDAKKWLGSLYNNTGWTYHDMGDYNKALELFERNVIWHTQRNTKQGLSIAKWCVARTLRSLGRNEEALEKQIELSAFNREIGLDEDGYNSEEIGECLLALNRTDESKPYFKKAYELLSKDIWLQENEKERLERLKKLGE
ncbi:MAG: tetratricopeptide repeat protein [Chlorobi bacterium]|nr:tetratricopeptide repeat protein [Chlorobiota bacterium]MCI0715317.1 tetratricopeptide repeat protein [Chlorobiota bacterium]